MSVWSERLTKARLMHERLNSYADYINQPHVTETGAIRWLGQAGLNSTVPMPALPGMPHQEDGTLRGTAPTPGQHTRALLAKHGYAEAEIETLLRQGIIAAP